MAILTACSISFFWTIIKSYLSPRSRQASSPSVSLQKPDVAHSCSPQVSEQVSRNIVSTPALDCADGVIKRGKFVVYYYDDDVREEDYTGNEEFEETEYKDIGPDDGVKFWCRDLDMGWHRYLDLSVFSGNVVRFWD